MLIYSTPSYITAFSTTRDGGVSISIPHLFMPHHQVHETTTLLIDEAFVRKNPLEQALALDGVDALATHLPGTCVCVKTADCIPVLLWDEQNRIVSAVHAGWKGTLKRIVEHNMDVLQATYGTRPEHLHAIIGPGIGLDSFEVGEEVYTLFATAGFPMEKLAKRYPLMDASPLKQKVKEAWHIDLWECNRLQLIKKGVDARNIHVSGIDTYQNHDRFFSARRKLSGRIINGIMLNN